MVRGRGSSLRIRGSLALTSVIFCVSRCRTKSRGDELTLKTIESTRVCAYLPG
jgi:hypothetical protein